jgi:predicted amidohydrolase YtcJ
VAVAHAGCSPDIERSANAFANVPARSFPNDLMSSIRIAAAAVFLAATTAASAQTTADLIVTGGRIYTVDPSRPFADGMAIKDGKVLFVGSAALAMNYKGAATQMVDLQGNTVIPGMIDAHVHLGGLGNALRNVDLVGTSSYNEVIARVVERAKTTPAGTWITGRGWDQNDWADTRFPTHEALSRAVPDHPVYLVRVDGHAALVNTAAMRAAGVTAATKDTRGGKLERNTDGSPTGVLIDDAMGQVAARIPERSPQEARLATAAAIAESNRWGLTGIHDAGVSRPEIALYENMAREGSFTLRSSIMIQPDDSSLAMFFARGPQSGLYNGTLWIRSIKAYADGALGSRGAALLEPYADDHTALGLIRTSPERFKYLAVEALKHGFQLNSHAIGDRGNRMVLDAIDAALKEVPATDHRFRIEHAQIIQHEDIPRFAKLGVIPSMQASHQTSDMYWAANRLGDNRLLGSYAWRSLLNTGVIIPNGSDFPVEQVNPLISFHAAFTRQDANNWPVGGWLPQEAMTRDEALKAMTIWPAHSAFMEKEVGSLEPGKYADFVILDQDIMRVPGELVLKTRVLSTWVGGKAVYRRSPTT